MLIPECVNRRMHARFACTMDPDGRQLGARQLLDRQFGSFGKKHWGSRGSRDSDVVNDRPMRASPRYLRRCCGNGCEGAQRATCRLWSKHWQPYTKQRAHLWAMKSLSACGVLKNRKECW